MTLSEDQVRQIVQEEIANVFTTASKAPSCPHCQSTKTHWSGGYTSGKRRRFLCGNCGKSSSVKAK